jgi:hypothetical protein
MGIVQDFEYDVFISYTHANNQPVSERQPGWVTELHDVLEKALWEEMRAKPKIWRDESGLDGRQVHGEIKSAIEGSAVLLAVVSGAYLESEYCCDKELRAFLEYRHPVFPLVVRHHKRVVVVVYDAEEVTPRPTWANKYPLAAELVDAPCANFCVRDPATGDRMRYSRPLRRDPDPYWTSVDRLVRHLTAVFTEMRKGAGNSQVASLVPASAAPVAKPDTVWRRVRDQQPGRNLVYVSHRAADPARLKEELRQRHYELAVLDHGSSRPIEARHETNLRYCDGMVVVYNSEGLDWAESVAHQARMSSRDQGRPKGIGVLAAPGSDSDFGLESELVVRLEQQPNGAIAGLDEFLSRLQETNAG